MDSPQGPELTNQLLDESGMIGGDVSCRRCGYNLRSLKSAGRCPECGAPIGLSISGDFLRFADPAWVETLATGIRYLFCGMALGVLFGMFGGLTARFISPGLAQAIGFVGGLLAFFGAWLLTEPDPSGIGEDRYTNTRKIIRLSLLLGLMSGLLNVPLQTSLVIGPTKAFLAVLVAVAALGNVVGEFAKLVYLEELALRIPEPDCAKMARFLRWAYGGSFGIMIVGGSMSTLLNVASGGSAWQSRPYTGGIACCVVFGGMLVLASLLMYLHLQHRLGRSLQEQARIARANWA